MYTLTKNLPIQGGCWIFRIDAGRGKIQGGEKPVRAVYIFSVSYSLISGGQIYSLETLIKIIAHNKVNSYLIPKISCKNFGN